VPGTCRTCWVIQFSGMEGEHDRSIPLYRMGCMIAASGARCVMRDARRGPLAPCTWKVLRLVRPFEVRGCEEDVGDDIHPGPSSSLFSTLDSSSP